MNTPPYSVHLQLVTANKAIPKRALLRHWAKSALSKKMKAAEVTLRIVDVNEMTELNTTYRHKNGPTNVLSFPMTLPQEIKKEFAVPMLGDIVICAEVVNLEAQQQQKSPDAHWAHMIIHGICHLLGYDHETDEEAQIMESLEIEILQTLGFDNPYDHFCSP